VGAVADVLSGLGSRRTSLDQLAFLSDRLYGGVPLKEAWTAHLSAFSRALGHRLNPHRDRRFRTAARAIENIASLQPQLASYQPRAIERLARAHGRLVAFDKHLAGLQSRLVRTDVDDALLAQVVDEVRGEYAVSSVTLEELVCDSVEEEVRIEVPRIDLVLILKNILRNAIMAVARDEGGRRVRISTRIDLEPTGEEAVRISVSDSSSAALTTEMIHGRGVGSGLGLVTTAIKRYGGAIEVRPAGDGFTKEVTVIFFRVFDDELDRGDGR
jgi:C4-dicarboxylate-specific signal transduction histidine kinase